MNKRAAVVENAAYEQDFHAWTQQQAALIRAGLFSEIDVDHIAEELEDLGGSQRREIGNRLSVLLMHLLKWRYQPGRRSPSWRKTMIEQRFRIAREIETSPSLRRYPAEIFDRVYREARKLAIAETELSPSVFPEQSPFTVDQALEEDWLPND